MKKFRKVTLTAVVRVDETPDAKDQADAYAAVAHVLLRLASRRRGGDLRPYMGIDDPITYLDVTSEPCDKGQP